jgi:tetratricopeptide (TPR) repeat protein
MNELVANTRVTRPNDGRLALLAWRGEMRLWCGQFLEALEDLNMAVERQFCLALCWRGAAHLSLGKTAEALADLNAHLAGQPDDTEALIWRAEALRRQGQLPAASKDLEHALELYPNLIFATLNRALIHAIQKDHAAMWRDIQSIPSEILHYFEWKTGLRLNKSIPLGDARDLLEDILASAGGVRRSDRYLFPLWMKEHP